MIYWYDTEFSLSTQIAQGDVTQQPGRTAFVAVSKHLLTKIIRPIIYRSGIASLGLVFSYVNTMYDMGDIMQDEFVMAPSKAIVTGYESLDVQRLHTVIQKASLMLIRPYVPQSNMCTMDTTARLSSYTHIGLFLR